MALELIAAVVAALTLAGLVYILRRWTGDLLPKWAITLAGAVGLIAFTVWSEYDWFDRVSAELPAGVVVVWKSDTAIPLRPWTYIAPITTRFVAMDTKQFAQHPANPALRMAKLYNFARWNSIKDGLMVFDCGAGRQVMITQGVEINAAGALTGGEWVTPGADDGFQKAACVAG